MISKGPESILGIGQLAMHGNLPAGELLYIPSGSSGVDVGVPAGPFMARVVLPRMDFGCDRLEHEHDLAASNNGEEVRPAPVTASLVANVESQPGLVECNCGVQVVDIGRRHKEGSNTVQHSVTAVDIEYLLLQPTLSG